jgi:hypothetical protein
MQNQNMAYIITQEERDVLSSIVPHLLCWDKFRVANIHEDKVIAVSISDSVNAWEICDKIASRNVYNTITNWLIEQRFAKLYDEKDKESAQIVLTIHGQYLAAYGNLDSFYSMAKLELSEDELNERMKNLLPEIPPYGEFNIKPNDRPDFDEINKLDSQQKLIKEMLVKEYTDLVKDEMVITYLANNGFAVNRFDIDHKEKLSRQLTDKGRKLKELGTIQSYTSYVNEEDCKVVEKKQKEERYFEIQLQNTEAQKEQNKLTTKANQSTIETNRISKTTNIYIAIFTGAAAIWYIRDVAKNIMLNYCSNNSLFQPSLTPISSKCLDVGTTLLIGFGIFFLRRNILRKSSIKEQ